MSELLQSIKADLTDRRLLPLVAVVTVALVAALAYALLSGGAASSPSGSGPAAIAPSAGGLAPSTLPSGGRAVAETTNGAAQQRAGSSRDPFSPLPGSVTAAAATAGKAGAGSTPTSAPGKATKAAEGGSAGGAGSPASGGGSGSSGGGGSSGSSGHSGKPSKPKTVYKVAIQFGVLPPNSSPESAPLQSFVGLSKPTPLPSAKTRLIEFTGVTVTSKGSSASFAIDSELLPSPGGAAVCLPSAVQCKVIELSEGRSEQLLYQGPAGETSTYELRVVSIASTTASKASLKTVLNAQALAAGRLFSNSGPLSASALRYAAFAGRLAFGGAVR